MKITRHFSKLVKNPVDCVAWKEVTVSLKNEVTGAEISRINKAEVPADFNDVAAQTITTKYFRRTEVPVATVPIPEKNINGLDVPAWLQRREATPEVQAARRELLALKQRLEQARATTSKGTAGEIKEMVARRDELKKFLAPHLGGETSAKQVFHRLAGFWTYTGFMNGYFDSVEDAKIFYDESFVMLATQRAAPNTPQWFNSGLYWAYGLEGEAKGFWRFDPVAKQAVPTTNFFQYPGLHACHIMGVADSLFDENGVYDVLVTEAKAFATGGGAGKNNSNLRSKYEYLSNGNKVTGSQEFALIDDRSAGAIKSGASQRKAAKMVIKDIDDPEVPEFIEWKGVEERKVAALAAGGFADTFEGPAYKTVSGQNSNNSVRVFDEFITALQADRDWGMTARTTGEIVRTMKASQLWKSIVDNAWASGDPGLQYESVIQDWNTCPVDGRIRATNPCAEYVFLDNTSCNLASINMQKFFDITGKLFLAEDFIYACNHWMMVLDISIEASQLPSKQLAVGTWNYRTTGLGHSGIAAVLMRAGIPYDSEQACHIMAGVTALMLAQTWYTSAKLAQSKGAFPRYEANKEHLKRVLRNHNRAATGNIFQEPYEGVRITPWEVNSLQLPPSLAAAIAPAWVAAIKEGEVAGYRNAFTSVIQPSGTVGLLMGCDTTSLEPDFNIIKYKKLAGGGYMKIVNESLSIALRNLGYTESQIDDIMTYVLGNNTLDDAPHVNEETLRKAGFVEEDIEKIEHRLEGAIQLYMEINADRLSDQTLENLGVNRKKDKGINILKLIGITREQYIEANKWICGHGTLEGAPHLKLEHLAVFDCASPSGYGSRYISWEAHIRAMSAVSPFISGGISKTINMPNTATHDDISAAYLMCYDGRGASGYLPGGVKCIALYRDGSKRSQPLNNPTDMAWWDIKKEAKVLLRGERKRPPKKRELILHEVTINDKGHHHKVIIKFGEYEDGTLAEVWIDVTKDNPDFYLAMKWAARAMSNAIQYGLPPEELATSFLLEQGGPGGKTDHPYITHCTSIVDFVVKLMLLEYYGDTTYCTKRPRTTDVRVGKVNPVNGNGSSTKSKMRTADDGVLKESVIKTQVGTACPVCGSTNIQRYPCATCLNCSTALGGCTA